jgi:phosphopantetheine--protein transferase-like protein
MEEKLKEIIAVYLKTTASAIDVNTLINRQAVSSSIILHRMYGELENEGFIVENYTDINSFGELLKKLSNAESSLLVHTSDTFPIISNFDQMHSNASSNPGVGIDLENISAFPECYDFREDEFYRNNFSSEEIAYCIIKKNPITSFAGLFSVKEAIVKADNNYSGRSFKEIVISHDSSGKPIHADFLISISHTENIVVGIALSKKKYNHSTFTNFGAIVNQNELPKKSPVLLISLAALIISVISLLIALFCFKLAHIS